METKFKAVADFLEESKLDSNYFYLISVYSHSVTMQGYSNKDPLVIANKYGSPKISSNGFVEFDFIFNEIPFQIILT